MTETPATWQGLEQSDVDELIDILDTTVSERAAALSLELVSGELKLPVEYEPGDSPVDTLKRFAKVYPFEAAEATLAAQFAEQISFFGG
jgi:hypothetical protein